MKFKLLEDKSLDMQTLINDAKILEPHPSRLFDTYDQLVDPQMFLDELTSNTSDFYKKSEFDRIVKNRPYEPFYRTLLGYLDYVGNRKPYDKLEPAVISKTGVPIDGRHRAAFCILLGIKLPVVFQKDDEDILKSHELYSELKSKFGDNFDYKPLCKEVTQYIEDNYGIQGIYDNVTVMSYSDDGLEVISRNGHCVIKYKNRLYDFTSNQYSNYPHISVSPSCPRILKRDAEIRNILHCDAYSDGSYVICL